MVLISAGGENTAWTGSIFSCCTSCHIRKCGITWPGSAVVDFEKRVLVIGKSQSGKSKLISVLNETTPTGSESYLPTNGTTITRVVVPPIGLTLVEVGGGLASFWHRSIDAKIDAVWYIVNAAEASSGDYSALTNFLALSSNVFVSRKLPLLVSCGSRESWPALTQSIESSGISRFSLAELSEISKPGLAASLDQLKLQLITQ